MILRNTSGFEVSVLGTSFNISAYKNQEKATVVLVEGSVNVKDQQNRHIKMVPNEKVELNQAGITGKAKVDARDYISWIDGILTLNNQAPRLLWSEYPMRHLSRKRANVWQTLFK